MRIIQGNILTQKVEVIVNPWNRNFIPWWLLLPQGLSGQIKKELGVIPFKEVSKYGVLQLGQAVLTSAGTSHYKGIIHVAGLNILWVATQLSVQLSTKNALELAISKKYKSIALPLIGAGTGGLKSDQVKGIMLPIMEEYSDQIEALLVEYKK